MNFELIITRANNMKHSFINISKNIEKMESMKMKTLIRIPEGKFAANDNGNQELTEAQRRIREAILRGNTIPLGQNGDVTGRSGQPTLTIPPGKLAASDNSNQELTEAQRRIREAILRGNTIPLGQNGDVTGRSGQPTLTIPPGKLAASDNGNQELTEAQRRIREAILRGNTIPLGQNGDVTGRSGQPTLTIPPGKLAYKQWYEREPERLEAEVEAMKISFPQFRLSRRSDGKLVWTGTMRPGLLGDNGWDWLLEAVYENNHPQAQMGSSVMVYLRKPDIETLVSATGWSPCHLIRGKEGLYLCTARSEDVHVGSGMETSAATVLRWAVKWLAGFELVLAGQLSKNEFDKDGVL